MSLLSFNSLLCWQITLTLLHVSWMGLVIGLIAAFANRVLRNSAANRRYRLNFASLLVFAASLPVMFVVVRGATAEFPANPIAVETPVAKLADLTPPVVEESALALPATDAADFAPTSPQVSPSGEVISAAIPSPTILPEPPSAWQRASSVGHTAAPFIAIVYALGVALMFVKLAFGVRVSRRLRSASQPITDTTILARMATQAKKLSMQLTPVIAYCEHTAVPIVVGLLRPMILIPAAMVNGLTIEQLESVLTHELAHLRRRDHLMIVVQRVLEAILFFHPVTWYLSHRLLDDRETSCDDLVLSIGGDRLQYAQSLLRVAELRLANQSHQKHTALAADGQRPSKLRLRIARLLESPEQTDVRISSLGWMLMSLIGLAIGTTSAASALSKSSFDDQEPHASNTETGFHAEAQARDKSPLEDTKTDIRTLWNSNNSIPIVGHVHDIHGKPVSGANVSHPVWVNSELKSDRTQTDAEGRFELSVIGKDLVTYSNMWIWHDGYSLATPSLYQFIPSVAEHASREVLLQPESLVRFRIERPDGRTLANADVYPAEMRISNYPESVDGMHGLYSFPPDDELKKFTMRKTDENGEVQLRHVPVEVLSAVGVVTEEFGIQEFYSEYLTGPRRLMLEPVGRLHGTAPPGTRIAIQSRPVSTPPVICEGRANVVADADGNFVVKALAAGKVLIMPHNAEHPEWLMEDQYAELQPASTLTLDIVPQATIPATGRLVLADSKLPIANVRVWLQVGPRRTSLGLMLTDADGKFTARCLPGKRLNAQVTLLPEATMLYPKPTQLIGSVPLDATSFELPDIEIRTIRIGKGKLVDANNNPVAGKYVQHYFDNKAIDYSFRTTDNGEFDYVIDKEIITDHWAAILKWSLRDKSGNAGHANDRFEVEATVISEDPLVLQIQDPDPAQANVLTPLPPHPPRVLPVDGEGRPIKDGEAEATGTPDKGQDFACTVIDPDGKPVIPVSMTIVDAANGRPITNARIMEGTHFKSNRAGRWEWGWTREQSNSEGRLETSLRALDHVIQFRIQGKGYRPALSQEFDAAALPDSPISLQIRLDADNGFSGTVLQPDGRPAAGAMIYTKSESKPNTSKNLYIENGVVDESQITSSTTADTSGRFQLQPHVEPFECLIDHDSGYLKLMDVELMQQSELELQPWASVKGELWLRGVPAANIGVQLLMRDEFLDDESQLPHIGFSQNIQTDAAGKFTFPKCIAGEWERIITYDETITSTRSGERNYVHYDTVRLLSGQERHEVIGKDGADVVGRVMFPADPKIVTNECDIYADNIDARMLNDGRSRQSYDHVKLQPDGSFHLFNLPVATHEIQFFVPVMGEQSLRTRYSQKIVITPERFVGRSPTSPIDLGEIQVEPIE